MTRRVFIFNLCFLIALSLMIILWARVFVLKVGDTEMINSPATNKGRVSFLVGCGWQVNETPVSVDEINIPETFDVRFEAYSKFHKNNGYNIDTYKGQTVTRYSYEVLNYDEEATKEVFAAVTVSGEQIVCAEIFTLGDDAFLKPIYR